MTDGIEKKPLIVVVGSGRAFDYEFVRDLLKSRPDVKVIGLRQDNSHSYRRVETPTSVYLRIRDMYDLRGFSPDGCIWLHDSDRLTDFSEIRGYLKAHGVPEFLIQEVE